MKSHYALSRVEFERGLDRTLAGSFPASDPPPWTLGVPADDDFFSAIYPAATAAAIEVVAADGRRFGGSRLTVLAEAIGLAAAVPLGILVVGVPVVALVWAVIRVIGWLAGTG